MKRQLAVNAIGVIGYLFALLSWVWSTMLLFTETKILEVLNNQQKTNVEPIFKLPEFSLPEPVSIAFAAGLVIFMVGLSIYSIFKAPAATIKTSSRALHKSADKALTVIQQHRPIPAKKQSVFTAKFIFYGKLATSIVPLIALSAIIPPASSSMELDTGLAVMISSAIGLLAILAFVAQYGLAKLLKVPPSKLV